MKDRLIRLLRLDRAEFNDVVSMESQDSIVLVSIALAATGSTVLIFFVYLIWSML